jgi:hypothetical protein
VTADDVLKEAIVQRRPTTALANRGRTLLQDGIQKALHGDADLDDVLRACS